MKYFIDTEFHEYKKEPFFGKPINTIELISIGIVGEDDREYYSICNEFDIKAAWDNQWLQENVLRSIFDELLLWEQAANYKMEQIIGHGNVINCLFGFKNFKRLICKYGKSKAQIARGIKIFIGTKESIRNWNEIKDIWNVKFYGYYADYDWVVFCWLFGKMIDLPEGFPMYCRDLKQIMDDKRLDKDWKRRHCPDPEGAHNALVDAKWNKEFYNKLEKITL